MPEPTCEQCDEKPAFEVAPGAFLCESHVQRLLLRSLAVSGLEGGATLLDPGRGISEPALRVTNLIRIQPIVAGQFRLAPTIEETTKRVIERARWELAERTGRDQPRLEGEVSFDFDEPEPPPRPEPLKEARRLGRFLRARARTAIEDRLGLERSDAVERLIRDFASDDDWVRADPSGIRAERLLVGRARAGDIDRRLRPMLVHWATAVGIEDVVVNSSSPDELAELLLRHVASRWDFVAAALYWTNVSERSLREVRAHACVDRMVSPSLREIATEYFEDWSDRGARVVFDF